MQYSNEVKQESLNGREKEVLEAIALGKQYKEIADKLFISVHTVQLHKKNIYKKLNIHSQSQATFFAIKSGLV